MSGFELEPDDPEQYFGLTPTKARYWHRYCPDPRCTAQTPAQIVQRHAVPAGFEIVGQARSGQSWVHVRGPGIQERKTRWLYAAISGRDVDEVDDR